MICRQASVTAIVVVSLAAIQIDSTNAFAQLFAPRSTPRTRISIGSSKKHGHRHPSTTLLNAISFGPPTQNSGGKVAKASLGKVGEEDRWSRKADKEESFDAECIMTIRGIQYNMTAWARAHPGGPIILRRFNGKDATTAFDKAGHSDAAYDMLKDFVIGTAEPYSSTKQDADAPDTSIAELSAGDNKRKVPRWRTKLFTKEDPIGIHKYMGIFSLLHFAFRFSQMVFGDPSCGLGTRMGKGPTIFAALAVVPHGILSASSLIFHTVPKERVVNRPMIWQEFRAHNIIFGLRSVATTLLAWAAIYKPSVQQSAIVLSCFSVIIANAFADVATAKLRENDVESTTATMPYWEGASIETQRKFKTFYAYCQFIATLTCMACANPAWPLCVLLPIQLASLLMTLVRKGLISARTYHIGYTASLCMPFLVGVRTALYAKSIEFPIVMGIAWALYQLRRKGVSKYILWAPIVAARIALGDKVLSPQLW